MSDNVTPIEANRPHITGYAQCRKCARSWVAVIAAEANPWLLECPGCGRLHGHVIGAFPESPYQAKVWSEEMWRYWYYEELPGRPVNVQSESPTETDGSAGCAGGGSTRGASILTASPSRWTTSSRDSLAGRIDSTTSAPLTESATEDEGGSQSSGSVS